MYCQSCGTEAQPGLNHCNRCGAQVSSPAASPAARAVLVPGDATGPAHSVTGQTARTFEHAYRGARA